MIIWASREGFLRGSGLSRLGGHMDRLGTRMLLDQHRTRGILAGAGTGERARATWD